MFADKLHCSYKQSQVLCIKVKFPKDEQCSNKHTIKVTKARGFLSFVCDHSTVSEKTDCAHCIFFFLTEKEKYYKKEIYGNYGTVLNIRYRSDTST